MATAARLPVGIDLPSSVFAAGHARAFLRAQLLGLSVRNLADAELLISELVSNAVRHGEPPIRLEITFDGTMTRFCVHDAGAAFKVVAPPDLAPPDVALPDVALPDLAEHDVPQHSLARQAGGRGLLITASVAANWGIIADGRAVGKTVWFALAD